MRRTIIILLAIFMSALNTDAQTAAVIEDSNSISQSKLNQFKLIEYELPLLVYKDRITLMNLSTMYSDPLSTSASTTLLININILDVLATDKINVNLFVEPLMNLISDEVTFINENSNNSFATSSQRHQSELLSEGCNLGISLATDRFSLDYLFEESLAGLLDGGLSSYGLLELNISF